MEPPSRTAISNMGKLWLNHGKIDRQVTRGATDNPALAPRNDRKNMVQSVEASLKRLKTDRIDLYFAKGRPGERPRRAVASKVGMAPTTGTVPAGSAAVGAAHSGWGGRGAGPAASFPDFPSPERS